MATRQARRQAQRGAPLTPALVALGDGLDEIRARFDDLDPVQRVEAEQAWPAHAVCRGPGVDPSAFFPPGDNPAGRASMYDGARVICAACEVWAECLAAGINEPFGYRGRTTPSQRTALRRARGEKVPKYLGPGPTPSTTSR